jgi:hypothetical protein
MAATDPLLSAAGAGAGAGARSRRQYVFSGELVRGMQFYGYCEQESVFVRMSVPCARHTSTPAHKSKLTLRCSYLYRPHDVTRLAGLLHGGKVGGEKSNRVFQPHDAHIPHHLQFMCDYNLVGMGIITGCYSTAIACLQHSSKATPLPTVSRAMFRAPLPDALSQRTPEASLSSSGPPAVVWDAGSVPAEARAPSSLQR